MNYRARLVTEHVLELNLRIKDKVDTWQRKQRLPIHRAARLTRWL